jgi:hypothetical protein
MLQEAAKIYYKEREMNDRLLAEVRRRLDPASTSRDASEDEFAQRLTNVRTEATKYVTGGKGTDELKTLANRLGVAVDLGRQKGQGDAEFAARVLQLVVEQTVQVTRSLTESNATLAEGLGELSNGAEEGDEGLGDLSKGATQEGDVVDGSASRGDGTDDGGHGDGTNTEIGSADSATGTPPSSAAAPSDCGDLSKYRRMQEMKPPERAVINAMLRDGVKPQCLYPNYTAPQTTRGNTKAKTPKRSAGEHKEQKATGKPAQKPLSVAEAVLRKTKAQAAQGQVDVGKRIEEEKKKQAELNATAEPKGLLAEIRTAQNNNCNTLTAKRPVTVVPEGCNPLQRALFKFNFEDDLREAKAYDVSDAEKAAICKDKYRTDAERTWAGCVSSSNAAKSATPNEATALQSAVKSAKRVAEKAAQNLRTAEEAWTRASDDKNRAQQAVSDAQTAVELATATVNAATENDKPAAEKALRVAQTALTQAQTAQEKAGEAALAAITELTQKQKAADDANNNHVAAEARVQEAKTAAEDRQKAASNTAALSKGLKVRRAAFADQDEFNDDDDDDDESSGAWSEDSGGGGGGASDDEEDGVDDVFEPALQRVLISMLLKNRRLSAADCVRRICACDFSGCQLPCLAEQRLVRGFVGYPYYRDAVRHVVHRLYPLLQPQYR